MTSRITVAAVDLGASSGRVMLGVLDAGGPEPVALHEVHRFANEPVQLPDGLHWDVVGIYRDVLTGLRAAGQEAARRGLPAPSSIGIDSWAVDYGLLDADGRLIGVPYCYRDGRTADGVQRVHAVLPFAELYPVNGLQYLPFNTLYQLAADQACAAWAQARTLLLLPDLLAYWLTGVIGAEVTNASTTGLLDVRSRQWAAGLAERLGVKPSLLPPLRQPGEAIGAILRQVADATGLPPTTVVTAVGSHDTASAVVGVPAQTAGFAYIACGTWSLVGLELDEPVLTEASRAANFTNEGGVDGTVRYLRNVMGLWLLSESLRGWERSGSPTDLERILLAAAEVPDGGPVIDPDDEVFLPPGDMPTRIEAACRVSGQPVPAGRPALVRCILDSLAAAYARAVDDAVRLSGRQVDVVHLVGGGSLNALLCRLTARATGRTVVAGPVEATALGNVLVQARSLGVVQGDLTALRALNRDRSLLRYDPDHSDHSDRSDRSDHSERSS